MTQNWFEQDATSHFKMKSLDPEVKIVAQSGWGGPELHGLKEVISVRGRILIYSGCHDEIRDDQGKMIWNENRTKAHGIRWFDVHLDDKALDALDENFQEQTYYSDDWSSAEDHNLAIEIIISAIATKRLYNKNLPIARLVQFSHRGLSTNEQNPTQTIELNTYVK